METLHPTGQEHIGLGRELAPILLNGLSDRRVRLTVLDEDFPPTHPPQGDPWAELKALVDQMPPHPNLNVHLWTREEIYEGMERV